MSHCAISLRRQLLPLKYHPAPTNFLNSFFSCDILMCSCMAVDCLSLAGIAGGGATDIWYQGQFLEQGRLFFSPLRTYMTSRNKLGLQAEKAANSADLGQGWGNFHVFSAPQGFFPAQEQAHTWCALVQWLLRLQETVVMLFMLLSHQSFL